MRVEIDKNLCDQCGTCISVCNAGALSMPESLSVDEKLCVNCGKCIQVCAFAALKYV
ncbi:MAG: 4Fe-4S binding protein [Fibrobacter sp.]|nr:4Fe-4S binding protein [Fibrobacter sp.]